MVRKTPLVELVAPGLDPEIPFRPGYDLLNDPDAPLSSSDAAAVGIALHALGGHASDEPIPLNLWRAVGAAEAMNRRR